VLTGAVVLDRVAADELGADGDLHHGDLHLAAAVLAAGPIVRAGEADVAEESTLRVPTPPWVRVAVVLLPWWPGAGRGLPVDVVAAGVGGDEHAPIPCNRTSDSASARLSTSHFER
jgi:hypothetical protein